MKQILLDTLGRLKTRLWRLLGLAADSLDYVNGPQTLPPPLSKQEEQDVFARMEQGDAADFAVPKV